MTKTPRWIATATSEAFVCETRMPWERGARRAEMIARRTGPIARTDAFDATVPSRRHGKTAA